MTAAVARAGCSPSAATHARPPAGLPSQSPLQHDLATDKCCVSLSGFGWSDKPLVHYMRPGHGGGFSLWVDQIRGGWGGPWPRSAAGKPPGPMSCLPAAKQIFTHFAAGQPAELPSPAVLTSCDRAAQHALVRVGRLPAVKIPNRPMTCHRPLSLLCHNWPVTVPPVVTVS